MNQKQKFIDNHHNVDQFLLIWSEYDLIHKEKNWLNGLKKALYQRKRSKAKQNESESYSSECVKRVVQHCHSFCKFEFFIQIPYRSESFFTFWDLSEVSESENENPHSKEND